MLHKASLIQRIMQTANKSWISQRMNALHQTNLMYHLDDSKVVQEKHTLSSPLDIRIECSSRKRDETLANKTKEVK